MPHMRWASCCPFCSCLQEEGHTPLSPGLSIRSLSRKDATAFVRAVRRYGLKSRLPAIAAEVAGPLEDVGLPQQRSLWRALVDGCKQALDMAAQPQDVKVGRGGKQATEKTGLGVISTMASLGCNGL